MKGSSRTWPWARSWVKTNPGEEISVLSTDAAAGQPPRSSIGSADPYHVHLQSQQSGNRFVFRKPSERSPSLNPWKQAHATMERRQMTNKQKIEIRLSEVRSRG